MRWQARSPSGGLYPYEEEEEVLLTAYNKEFLVLLIEEVSFKLSL